MAGAGSNWLSGVNVVLVMAYGSLVRAGRPGGGGPRGPAGLGSGWAWVGPGRRAGLLREGGCGALWGCAGCGVGDAGCGAGPDWGARGRAVCGVLVGSGWGWLWGGPEVSMGALWGPSWGCVGRGGRAVLGRAWGAAGLLWGAMGGLCGTCSCGAPLGPGLGSSGAGLGCLWGASPTACVGQGVR